MTLETPQNHEVINSPHVLFTFCGYTHADLNLQSVPDIAAAFRSHLGKAHGKKVLYLEAANLTDERAKLVIENYNRRGFVGFLISEFLAEKTLRFPGISRVEGHIKKIEEVLISDQDPIGSLVKNGLLDFERIQSYHINKILDQIRDECGGFEVECESHSDNEIHEITRVRKNYIHLEEQAKEAWWSGRLDEAIRLRRQTEWAGIDFFKKRSAVTIDKMKGKLGELAKLPNGGSIFALFGNTHIYDAKAVQVSLRPRKEIQFEYTQDSSVDNIRMKIKKDIHENVPISDTLLAQSLLHQDLLYSLILIYFTRNKGTHYSNNWKTLDDLASTIAQSYFLDELRTLIKGGISLENIWPRIKDNPLAAPLFAIFD